MRLRPAVRSVKAPPWSTGEWNGIIMIHRIFGKSQVRLPTFQTFIPPYNTRLARSEQKQSLKFPCKGSKHPEEAIAYQSQADKIPRFSAEPEQRRLTMRSPSPTEGHVPNMRGHHTPIAGWAVSGPAVFKNRSSPFKAFRGRGYNKENNTAGGVPNQITQAGC